jgi:hypothetical protein
MYCESCGSNCRLLFDNETTQFEPEYCPFCGEIVGTLVDEDYDDELGLDDDGLGDDDDNDTRWN